jgi:hypothetical protein
VLKEAAAASASGGASASASATSASKKPTVQEFVEELMPASVARTNFDKKLKDKQIVLENAMKVPT